VGGGGGAGGGGTPTQMYLPRYQGTNRRIRSVRLRNSFANDLVYTHTLSVEYSMTSRTHHTHTHHTANDLVYLFTYYFSRLFFVGYSPLLRGTNHRTESSCVIKNTKTLTTQLNSVNFEKKGFRVLKESSGQCVACQEQQRNKNPPNDTT